MSRANKTVLSKTFLAATSALAVAALAASVSTQGQGPGPGAGQNPPGLERVNGRDAAAAEVLVRFDRELPPQALAALEAQIDAGQREVLDGATLMRFQSRRFDVETLVAFFSQLPEVIYAEPNYLVTAIATPNDSLFGELWGLDNSATPAADISAVPAWDITTGSTGVVTGIIDTGVDYTHPDLSANMWRAPASFTVNIGGQDILCPAGSYGFNAITNSCDPMDDNSHGTHVAGTIGATGHNGAGVVGVNWTTRMMGLKFLAANGSGSTSNAIKSIQFAIQARTAFGAAANVRILSNSWGGGGYSQALLDAINQASANDMLFVAAAGNSNVNTDSSPHYPSSYNAPNIVSVASTTNTDTRSSFSNYGAASVDLGAPGSGILSTVLNAGYGTKSGTSMAAPHVSGAGALVLAACTMNTSTLKDLLLQTVDPIAALAGITVTGGRLNVDRAVRTCAGAPPPGPEAPPAPANLQATAGNAQVALSWSASSGVTSYAVRRRIAGADWMEIAAGLTATSHTDTSATNGVTYEYVVTASANGLESEPSNLVSATPTAPPPPTTPGAPTGVKAQANGKDKITVSWLAVGGAASYTVKRSTTSGGPYTVVASGVTGTSYQNASLASKTTYYYVVSAVNGAGEGPNSNQVSARTK